MLGKWFDNQGPGGGGGGCDSEATRTYCGSICDSSNGDRARITESYNGCTGEFISTLDYECDC